MADSNFLGDTYNLDVVETKDRRGALVLDTITSSDIFIVEYVTTPPLIVFRTLASENPQQLC